MQTPRQTLSDNETLAAWRAGDRCAGEALLAKHWTSISRFFTRKLGPQCEDLIQETFTACVEGIDRYRGDSSFRTYLFGIAHFTFLRHLRTKVQIDKHFDPSVGSVADYVHSYTSVIAANRRHERLLQAMQELPVITQTMIELHYWEQMTMVEISKVVELPVNTVKSRLRRGRLQLAKALQESRYGI